MQRQFKWAINELQTAPIFIVSLLSSTLAETIGIGFVVFVTMATLAYLLAVVVQHLVGLFCDLQNAEETTEIKDNQREPVSAQNVG